MHTRDIIATLQAGQTLFMAGRGTREEEATLAVLYERGLLAIERVQDGLLISWREPEPVYVTVRVVRRTWFGFTITTERVRVQ